MDFTVKVTFLMGFGRIVVSILQVHLEQPEQVSQPGRRQQLSLKPIGGANGGRERERERIL